MRFPDERWAALLERRYRAILLGSLLVCLLSGLSLLRLRLDFDVLEMLPRGRPAFDDFKTFVSEFGQLDELLVLVRTRPGSAAARHELQAFADQLAARLARLDTIARVQARIDTEQLLDGLLGRFLVNYIPESAFDAIEQKLTPRGIDAQLAANYAALSAPFDLATARALRDDPFGFRRVAAGEIATVRGTGGMALLEGYLMSPRGDALLLFVRPTAGAFDVTFSARLMEQVRAAEAETREAMASESIEVEYAGGYAYSVEDAATIRRDVHRYTLFALLGVLAVFYAGYRNLRVLPFVTYPLAVSTLLTFAVDLLVYGQLNAVSTSFAAILYGLSIDTGIHFYSRLLEERRRLDLRQAVAATLRGVLRPTIAASTTSAAVFAVVGFSCLSGVSQLGFLTAFGVLLNPLQLLVLYPALVFLLPPSAQALPRSQETPRLARLAEAVAARALLARAAAAAGGALLLVLALRIDFDVSLMHLRPEQTHASRVQDEIEDLFGKQALGATVLVRRADLESALRDSELVGTRLTVYREEKLLHSLSSVSALLPSEHAQRRRLERFRRLPRAAALQRLREALPRHGFAEHAFAPFMHWFQSEPTETLRLGDPALAPVEAVIERFVRGRPGAYTVATYVEPANAESLAVVQERLRRELPDVECVVTGRPLLERELDRVLHRELIAFLILALAGNFALLLASFGWRDALRILVPVTWAALALLAVMEVAGIPLNPVNLIAPILVLGLGVDYAAFLIARTREEGAIGAAIRSNGTALIVTGLTTVVGFGSLSLSVYPALASMGVLAALGILLSLLASLVLLPALTQRRSGSAAHL